MIELDKADTGFAYMVEAHKIGGPYMKFITLLLLIVLGLAIWKIYELTIKKQANTHLLELIRMAGTLAVGLGFLSQIIGIVQALEAIRAAADVSPQIVMGGAIVSFYAPAWGLIVFVFSVVLYYTIKEIIKQKM
jgi:flagellar motor component MotA